MKLVTLALIAGSAATAQYKIDVTPTDHHYGRRFEMVAIPAELQIAAVERGPSNEFTGELQLAAFRRASGSPTCPAANIRFPEWPVATYMEFDAAKAANSWGPYLTQSNEPLKGTAGIHIARGKEALTEIVSINCMMYQGKITVPHDGMQHVRIAHGIGHALTGMHGHHAGAYVLAPTFQEVVNLRIQQTGTVSDYMKGLLRGVQQLEAGVSWYTVTDIEEPKMPNQERLETIINSDGKYQVAVSKQVEGDCNLKHYEISGPQPNNRDFETHIIPLLLAAGYTP